MLRSRWCRSPTSFPGRQRDAFVAESRRHPARRVDHAEPQGRGVEREQVDQCPDGHDGHRHRECGQRDDTATQELVRPSALGGEEPFVHVAGDQREEHRGHVQHEELGDRPACQHVTGGKDDPDHRDPAPDVEVASFPHPGIAGELRGHQQVQQHPRQPRGDEHQQHPERRGNPDEKRDQRRRLESTRGATPAEEEPDRRQDGAGPTTGANRGPGYRSPRRRRSRSPGWPTCRGTPARNGSYPWPANARSRSSPHRKR